MIYYIQVFIKLSITQISINCEGIFIRYLFSCCNSSVNANLYISKVIIIIMNIVKSYKKVQKAIALLDSVLGVFEKVWDSLEVAVKELEEGKKELKELHKAELLELQNRQQQEQDELNKSLVIAKHHKTRVAKVLGRE